MPNYVVYCHTNKINGKRYVGLTCQAPEKRWSKRYRDHPYFSNAIDKYGWDGFSHEILFSGMTQEQAEQKEIELISLYKSNNKKYGYNLSNGGNSTGKHSEETKRKISLANTGKKYSKEICEKLSRIRKGKRKGTPVSKNLIESLIRAVNQYSLDGEYIRTFNSITEAARFVGRNDGNIWKVCSGKTLKCADSVWRYADQCNGTENIDVNLSPRYHCKKVRQINMNGNVVAEYDSISLASSTIDNKNARTAIGNCCNGRQKTAFGYKWEFI